MTIDGFIKILIEQATPVALAAFSMWMLDKVWKERLAETQRHAEEIDELRKETLLALQQNTKAMTMLCGRGDAP